MIYQTCELLLHTPPGFVLICFVFFSTICSYNFHWYLTPESLTSSRRIQWTQHHKGLHLIFYFIGLIGSAVCFFMMREHWIAMAFAAFVTFLYSAPKLPQDFFKALKEIAIGKTIFLAIVWTYVTTMLPIFVQGKNWQMEYSLFACSRFFLIYAICIPFDYRDREDDKQAGVRSMITLLNERGIDYLFFFSLLLFAVTTTMLSLYNYSVYAIIILLIPGLITALLYNYSKKNFSDYLYYFVLDGLMMLSALLMMIFGI
jgi:4-hydroxybenzoate polyprenyltransferase